MGVDANTRSPEKEIFVLHTRWGGKIHGIDLKVLNPAQIETLKAVMDPRNNRMLAGEARQDAVSKVQQPTRSDHELKQMQLQLSNMKGQMKKMMAFAAIRKNKDGTPMMIAPATMNRYNAEVKMLQDKIDNWEMKVATPEQQDQTKLAQKPLTPMAKQILQRVLPGRIINNPRIFYNLVVKPIIGRVDAYRTFYRGRMKNVLVDPRWSYVEGAGQAWVPEQGIQERQKMEKRGSLFKAKGLMDQPGETEAQKQQRINFMGKFQEKKTPFSAKGGGVMEQMGRRVGTNVPTVKAVGPRIIKPPKNG